MDLQAYSKLVSQLRTVVDLQHLLNDIVRADLGKRAFRFSVGQLKYYSNPRNATGRYHEFSIPKKSGGTRTISAPNKGLKHILHYLNIMLRLLYKPSDYAMGFCEGRSVKDNAMRHIGQNYVFNTDLEDFFPSIQRARVWKRLQLKPFNLNPNVANIIAGLCCIRIITKDGKVDYVLPQGAPTSPLLTNAICDNLDRRLAGLARRFGLHYTRYADDINFSSMHNVYQPGGEFMTELRRIIEGQNFRVNEKKTRLQKFGSHQEVTGLTVNSRVNVGKSYISEIRTLLHIWEKYGYKDAYESFWRHRRLGGEKPRRGGLSLENVIYGKLQYLRMVKGEKDPVYRALQERYNNLTSPLYADRRRDLDYLRSFKYDEFERIMGGEIEFVKPEKGSVYGKLAVNGEDIRISVSKKIQPFIEKAMAAMPTVDTNESETQTNDPIQNHKRLWHVALASNGGHSPFWILTEYDPIDRTEEYADIPATEILNIWERDGIQAAMRAYSMFKSGKTPMKDLFI